MPTIAYKCNHCSSIYDTFEKAEAHEKLCVYAPNRKTCHTCEHNVYEGYPFGGPHVCQNKNAPTFGKHTDGDDFDASVDCEFHEKD
jgi:hypothetical protein